MVERKKPGLRKARAAVRCFLTIRGYVHTNELCRGPGSSGECAFLFDIRYCRFNSNYYRYALWLLSWPVLSFSACPESEVLPQYKW